MIQPINALTPRAGFRGSNGTKMSPMYGKTSSKIALINAGGVAAAAGGIATAIARGYTSSWGQAGVLGIFGACLTMFFMTPHLIEKIGLNKIRKAPETEIAFKEEVPKVAEAIKEHLKPAKKLVHFRQQA